MEQTKQLTKSISKYSQRVMTGMGRLWRIVKPLSRHGYIWFVTVGLLVAAQTTLIWAPRVGIYLNALALVGLSAVAILQPTARKVAISMAILPVATMITASFMLHTIIGQITVFEVALLLLAILYRYVFTLEQPLSNSKLTIKGYCLILPLMLITGQLIGVIGYGLLRHHYPFAGYSLPLVALVAVVFAFAEEMLLRGLIQQQGSQLFHPAIAALTSTILYVFLSLDHATMLTLPAALVMGAVLSFVYYQKQNLILTTTINAAAKLTYIGLVAGFILRR
jgi:membrane protease YdiL (CAAX protease family)